ncbi:hypothetical protein ACTSKR_03770 [Chitinibacteraceae bacterium HSL-7]
MMKMQAVLLATGLSGLMAMGVAADMSREVFVKEAHQHAAKLFDELDTNKDGVLSEQERVAKRKEVMKDSQMNPPRLHGDIDRESYYAKVEMMAGKVFDHADRDHNGMLSDAERQRARDTFRMRLQQHRVEPDVGAA